jgi:hypothetical protein
MGKGLKGKAPKGLGRILDDTCHFCKQPGHYKAQCPKFAALSASTGYGRIRAKLLNEKVYVYDLLEDSVDSDVCANCLSASAIGTLAPLQWKIFCSRNPQSLS